MVQGPPELLPEEPDLLPEDPDLDLEPEEPDLESEDLDLDLEPEEPDLEPEDPDLDLEPEEPDLLPEEPELESEDQVGGEGVGTVQVGGVGVGTVGQVGGVGAVGQVGGFLTGLAPNISCLRLPSLVSLSFRRAWPWKARRAKIVRKITMEIILEFLWINCEENIVTAQSLPL